MTIETTSLELSKRLAALGVPQNSFFSWEIRFSKAYIIWPDYHEMTVIDTADLRPRFAALTSGELGKMLPAIIGMKYLTVTKNKNGDWHALYEDLENFGTQIFTNENMTEAMGLLLEFLLLNGLIKVSDLQV